jgi:DUF971 family protein
MIKKFTLDHPNKQLIIDWHDGKHKPSQLSYEYLRVSANEAKKELVSHKRQVKLVAIEPVGKHGFRVSFNDDYSVIFSAEALQALAENYQQRWQQYLTDLQQSGHSREAIIDIKQL